MNIGQKIPTRLRAPWTGLSSSKQIDVSRIFMKRFLSTEDGRIFFALFLKEHFYFDKPESPAEQALRNYASYFIRKYIGIENADDEIQMASAILDSKP